MICLRLSIPPTARVASRPISWATFGIQCGLVDLAFVGSDFDGPGTERDEDEDVLSLVDQAVRRRRISQRDGRLVALHRVFGYTNVEIGRIEGNQPCTIRKRRLAAEAEIAALAVA